jgi:hypothetical protein
MAKTRLFSLAVVSVGIGLWAAAPASADGLARFEKSLKSQIPPDALTYKSSKALGDNGFELDDVVITPPPSSDPKADKPQPIKVKAITVERLDFDSIDKQQPPLFAKIKFDGVTTGATAAGFDLKSMAGLDSLAADFGVDYELDAAKKTFTLKRMELNLNGLAKLQTSMVVDGVAMDAAVNPDAAMANASLKTADVIYDDHSLLAKALPIAAAMQGSDPKVLTALAIGFLDGARVGQGEAAQKAIDSLVAYVEDYQKPKGPLHISLAPPKDVSNADLSNAKTADDMVKLLGIQISYAGTRSSKPGEAGGAADAGAAKPGAKDVPAKEEDDDDDDSSKTMNKKK